MDQRVISAPVWETMVGKYHRTVGLPYPKGQQQPANQHLQACVDPDHVGRLVSEGVQKAGNSVPMVAQGRAVGQPFDHDVSDLHLLQSGIATFVLVADDGKVGFFLQDGDQMKNMTRHA